MKKIFYYLTVAVIFAALSSSSCDSTQNNSDTIQRNQQEKILADATATVGMPSIKNFREKKLMKDVYERRDQNGLITYTYIFCEMLGKYTYLGESIGYGIPAATQFTNPYKVIAADNGGTYLGQSPVIIPQADPNGLFSPASAEGTWIVMYDPVSKEALPQYIESRISVFSYKLPARLVVNGYKDL